MNRIGVKKTDFELSRYVKKNHLLHPKKKTSFHFQDGLIKRLPLIKDGSKDLYDLTNNVKQFSLVLRISKTAKTFYIKPAQRTMIKLGKWQEPNSNTHIKHDDGCMTVSGARVAFNKKVKELQQIKPEVLHFREWSIERYLDEQYVMDRAKYKIKNGTIRPITQKTLNAIKRDMKPLLNKKLKELHTNWLHLLIDHWGNEVINPTNGKITIRTADTNRKAYTQINAMINVWFCAGYVAKNPIDGEVTRFKDRHAEQREIITFDNFSNEDALRYLWHDDVPGSKAAKLVLATMIVAGVRNSEAYRNTRDNFRVTEREIFIPSQISGKTSKSRTIPIESNFYWEMVEDYLASAEYYKNEHNHMFPSHKASKTGHITEGATRKPWYALKSAFKLPKKSRPYDFRHTFASNVTKKVGLEIASTLVGDNPETVMKYYIKHDVDKARQALAEIQSNEKQRQASQVHELNNPVVQISELGMPESVRKHYLSFINGRNIPEIGKLHSKQWDNFIDTVRAFNVRHQIDEIEEWLFFQ